MENKIIVIKTRNGYFLVSPYTGKQCKYLGIDYYDLYLTYKRLETSSDEVVEFCDQFRSLFGYLDPMRFLQMISYKRITHEEGFVIELIGYVYGFEVLNIVYIV